MTNATGIDYERTADEYRGAADELTEIKMEMEELIERAKSILRPMGMINRRAEAYWLAHIEGAIDGRGSMITMQETIDELIEKAEEVYDD